VQAVKYAIQRSCINKAEVVAADEREGGVRATLNLGHTFGHAMETWQSYGPPFLLSFFLQSNINRQCDPLLELWKIVLT